MVATQGSSSTEAPCAHADVSRPAPPSARRYVSQKRARACFVLAACALLSANLIEHAIRRRER